MHAKEPAGAGVATVCNRKREPIVSKPALAQCTVFSSAAVLSHPGNQNEPGPILANGAFDQASNLVLPSVSLRNLSVASQMT
jgi:hypothetical protein